MAQGIGQNIKTVWAEYGKSHSERRRNQLMEHYLPLVRHIAQRIHAKLPKEVELDDLISSGVFGLMDAIAAFDPSRSVKFETYCASRVRGAILDELRSWDWVPRLARLRALKLMTATHQLRLELGRDPSHDELAGRLNVPLPELKKILRDGSLIKVMPMSRQCGNGGDNDDQVFSEGLEDRRGTGRGRWLECQELKRVMQRDLSRAEQLIIVLYYFEQMTMKEIGLTLDLSESRVSQMHSSVLVRLQKHITGDEPLTAAA